MTRRTLERTIEEQRQWIAKCGGSLAGYVSRYGAVSEAKNPACFGEGGPAIYAADVGELRRLQDALSRRPR